MKRTLLLLLLVVLFIGAKSQDKIIIMTESGLPYTSQTWFCSGAGNSLQESKIKKHWDEGRCITSVAYTDNGWFVTMAKNTGIGMQTYSYSADWPQDWIKKKWDEDYYITSISKSNSKWCVVMSKGLGYTSQSWSRKTWDKQKQWYNEKRDKGYYITSMTYDGSYWTLVMSKTDKIKSQGYLWANSYDELKSKIKEYIWDKSLNIHAIGYGDGSYFVAFGAYSQNNGRGQNYVVNPSDVSDYIDKRWADSHDIAYIGGGYNGSNYVNNNDVRYNVNTSGLLIDQTWVDPSLTGPVINSSESNSNPKQVKSYNKWEATTVYDPCPRCSKAGKCPTCNGTGKVLAYGNRHTTTCGTCHGSGLCPRCNGSGKKARIIRGY